MRFGIGFRQNYISGWYETKVLYVEILLVP